MDIEQKKKLVQILYPNEKIRDFMINDLYQELKLFIDFEKCYSEKYLEANERKKSLENLKDEIMVFLKNNGNYANAIQSLFLRSYNDIINEIVMGYCFYITQLNLKEIDIFKDKKSICYSEVSIIDIL